MTRIEDELHDAAAELRRTTSDVDVDRALERVLAGDRRRPRGAPLLAAAAAAIVVALVASAALWWPASGTDVVADRPDEPATTTAPTSTTAPMTTTTPDPTVPTVPLPDDDLQDAPTGREITFEGIGDVQLGQVVPPERVSSELGQSGCGYWPDGEVVQSADAPPTALVGGADTAEPRVTAVYLRNNTSYRTASGIGIGTSLATLERIYGDRLVVDLADGWENPTDGLLASYQPVAAVRDGARAITYLLNLAPGTFTPVVEGVKVSAADFWGDDEGCA